MADQIRITFPDGSKRDFDRGVSPHSIAVSISNSLAKRTVAALLNDELISVEAQIKVDATLELLDFSSPQGRDVFWHTSAHILAQAVKELYPAARLGIGPPVAEGFYYDVEFPQPISAEDLQAIEERMQSIVEQNLPLQRSELSREEAKRLFSEMDELYKVELIDELERLKG